jgi:hypothetical protein
MLQLGLRCTLPRLFEEHGMAAATYGAILSLGNYPQV